MKYRNLHHRDTDRKTVNIRIMGQIRTNLHLWQPRNYPLRIC